MSQQVRAMRWTHARSLPTSYLKTECWPFAAGLGARALTRERVKLLCPLCCALPQLLLLCTLGLDALRGVIYGQAAEFVGFGARQGSSREGVASGALRVDGAHSKLIVACLLGSKFTGQQREPFLLVSPRCRPSTSARCFNGASGVGHAGAALRFLCR
ncbi:hypothetical protein EFN05_08145, partial [Propionibacterium freudenreichii]|nr:hypothetical protein [Propionibacterium freudenreichii]